MLCNRGKSTLSKSANGDGYQLETEKWLTVVSILALATYAVSRSLFSDLVEPGDVLLTGDTSSALALQLTPCRKLVVQEQ